MNKNEYDSFYNEKQSRNLVLGLIIILGIFLFITLIPVFTAILSAIILYTLFKPMYIYFINKKNYRASLSALIVLIISFLIIVLPLLGLSLMIINKLILFQQNPEILTTIVNKITVLLGTQVDVKNLLNNGLNDISKWAIGAFSFIINGAFTVFVTLVVLYFMLFYMFISHEKFENSLMKYLPFGEQQSRRYGKELKNVTYSNVIGQGLIGITQGIIVALGFLIFGIPDPLFWGIISIFVCFLPIVGAPVIFVPAGVIELAYGNTFEGVGILIWGFILVTLVDNFLRQFISKKIANTHPLITIIGVIIGVPVFGLIGLVMGPLLLSYFILLVQMYETTYLHPNEIGEKKVDNIMGDK